MKVVRSFRVLAHINLRQAREHRACGHPIAAAHHLTEALEWRKQANRLRSTAT